MTAYDVVNCFQNLCKFASETTLFKACDIVTRCELLSKFV